MCRNVSYCCPRKYMKLEDENMKMVKFISATLNRAPTLGRLIE